MSRIERLLLRAGIPEEKARVLLEAGVRSPQALLLLTVEELSALLRIPESEAKKLIRLASEEAGISIKPFPEALKEESRLRRLTTGVESLDRILGGGFPLTRVIEVYGESGTGKTQLAHQLCVTVQLPEDAGGLDSGAVYLDSEGGFRPERLIALARRFQLKPQAALRRVLHAKVLGFAEQLSAVSRALMLLESGFRLLILDTIISPIRRSFDSPMERQLALSRLLGELRRFAASGGLVLALNNVVTDPETGELRPAGGMLLGQMVDLRLMLGRKDGLRFMRVVYAPDLPEDEAEFRITEEGLVEA